MNKVSELWTARRAAGHSRLIAPPPGAVIPKAGALRPHERISWGTRASPNSPTIGTRPFLNVPLKYYPHQTC